MPARVTASARRARRRTRCRVSRSSRRTAGRTSRASTSCARCAASTPACPAACTCTSERARPSRDCTHQRSHPSGSDMADRPETPENDTQWRTAGDRIQTLLDSCAAGGGAAHERAQQLVREVVGLYGAALERIMSELAEHAGQDSRLIERLATDDLVASLLLVHGLHPHDVHRRVSQALGRVRPYLGSHGGDVDLLEIADGPPGAQPGEMTLRLAFKGSCKSCPSSAVTLELAVEDAGRAAAPEISDIEGVAAATTTRPRA